MDQTSYTVGVQIANHEARIMSLESEVATAKHYLKRLVILLLIWSSVLLGVTEAGEAGKFAASIIRGLTSG